MRDSFCYFFPADLDVVHFAKELDGFVVISKRGGCNFFPRYPFLLKVDEAHKGCHSPPGIVCGASKTAPPAR